MIIATLVSNAAATTDFERQDTATQLTVMIKRATLKLAVRFELPTPLADLLDDIRVHAPTAESSLSKQAVLPKFCLWMDANLQ